MEKLKKIINVYKAEDQKSQISPKQNKSAEGTLIAAFETDHKAIDKDSSVLVLRQTSHGVEATVFQLLAMQA